jgi:hypothetical protein
MELITIKKYRGDSYGSAFKLPIEILDTTEDRISSQFKRGTQDVLRGLTTEEEKIYLPAIVGVAPSSEKWEEATKIFWANMSIIVPKEGLILNKAVKDGKPENVQDYIRYKFILAHSEVAMNEKSLEWPQHRYFIIDGNEVKKEQDAAFEKRLKANKEYLMLQTDEGKQKIEWVATELREKGETFDRKSAREMLKFIEMKKDEVKDKVPVGLNRFLRVALDPNLEQKAMLNKLLEHGIIDLNGNSYFYDGDILGVAEEAIAWIKNPLNSKAMLEIQEKLKAVMA